MRPDTHLTPRHPFEANRMTHTCEHPRPQSLPHCVGMGPIRSRIRPLVGDVQIVWTCFPETREIDHIRLYP